jgi:hypothetical protein
MPIPISNIVDFNPEGGVISVELRFNTMLLCTYDLDVREAGSNQSVQSFPIQGDNSNAQEDCYPLPLPTSANDGRTVLNLINILDQTGGGGPYECLMKFLQDSNPLGQFTTGVKIISGNHATEIFAIRLHAEG